MKRNVSLLLALMLVVCFMVLPVCAEELETTESPTEATEAVIATEVGDGTDQDIDGVDADTAPTEEIFVEMEEVTVFGEEDPEEEELTKVDDDEEIQEYEMEYVTTYGEEAQEEEGGFWAWLVSLWEAILNFFGL